MNLSEEAKKAVKGLVGEVSASMTRMEGERDLINEALKRIASDHDLDKKILRKMCRTYHKQRFHTEKQDNEEFEATYAEVFDITDEHDDESTD
jgi:hypothetical protein